MINLETALPSIIQTPRLQLRKPGLEDDLALYEAARASVNEIYPFMAWCHPEYEMEESRSFLLSAQDEWQQGTAYSFCIEHEGRLAGICGINSLNEYGGANLGYWIRSDETARGYASEATIALAQYGFDQLQLNRIEIVMSVKNLASQKVAEKAGALYEATLRDRLLLHGELHAAHLYSLVPSDLQ